MINTKKMLKQFNIAVIVVISIYITSCNQQNKSEKLNNLIANQASVFSKDSNSSMALPIEISKNVRSIYQDKNGIYWFGTNASGVYRYDGKTLIQYTIEDGLSDNQVQSIQEDKSGSIWFGTGVFGVSRFDGKTFTTFTNKESLKLANSSFGDWKIEPNDLWFYAGGGVYRSSGSSFAYLPLAESVANSKQSKNAPYSLSRYAVYSILKDKKGNIWFGTQAEGVCCYDGKSFTWFTEKGLAGSAVLGLFEDSKGNIWFGNNGSGLFRYDGKSLTNFTEEKGLDNKEFKISGKSGPGTLARIYSINEDNSGNLWIGTVDAGVWKYDGTNLVNYTTINGLGSNAINLIYKDRNGELWFGTDGDGVFKFNGNYFSKFIIK